MFTIHADNGKGINAKVVTNWWVFRVCMIDM